jgi:nitroreductase
LSELEKHVFGVIYARRSIRVYQDRPLERDKIVQLLKAGMAAPSACNIQPWEYIVVTEKATLDAMRADAAGFGDYNAPVAIVVCGYNEFIPWGNDEGALDCAAAIENMLIAATAMGLGSVWMGGFDRDRLRAILNIPERVFPIGVVYFGYPAESWAPRTKYLDEAVYWEAYDPPGDRPMIA